MDSLKNQPISEMLLILKKKYSFQDKDLSFIQGFLMDREENFKFELENAKKNFEEEKKGIEGRYRKIMEEYKEEIQVLKMEKSEAEDKLRVHYEKLIELNGRVSRLTKGMRKIDEDCSGKSGNEEPLPINLDSERGDPTRNPSACQAIVCFKNNLNAVSDKPEHLPVIIIRDGDNEMDRNKLASASNRCGLRGNLTCCQKKKEVHVQDSNSTKKRKRSMNEGENSDGSSFGRQTTIP